MRPALLVDRAKPKLLAFVVERAQSSLAAAPWAQNRPVPRVAIAVQHQGVEREVAGEDVEAVAQRRLVHRRLPGRRHLGEDRMDVQDGVRRVPLEVRAERRVQVLQKPLTEAALPAARLHVPRQASCFAVPHGELHGGAGQSDRCGQLGGGFLGQVLPSFESPGRRRLPQVERTRSGVP